MITETDDKEAILEVFQALLDDDEGVCAEGYDAMLKMADSLDYDPLTDMLHAIEATDGRFYLPEGYERGDA